jgi:GDPmannose 4,6-dehydratase
MTRSLIIGHNGQDGQLLSAHLAEQGGEVIGLGRKGVENFEIKNGAEISLQDAASLKHLIEVTNPDDVYYLAAHHNSSEDGLPKDTELFRLSFDTNTTGLINTLEAMKAEAPKAALFYASSSHIFGQPEISPQDEATPIHPANIYGISKSAGMDICRYYRDRYNMFIGIGIMYNHESHLRTKNFVSRKIINAAVQLSKGRMKNLEIANLSATADWGYAKDYVRAMEKIVTHSEPTEFIVATGVLHTIRDWAEYAFAQVGLNWNEYVLEPSGAGKMPQVPLCGNAQKLVDATGWDHSVDFHGLIDEMLSFEQSVN